MRLLERNSAGEFSLTKHFVNDDEIPPYAILSHTWAEGEEVLFEDLKNSTGKDKSGYNKIRFCGEQARRDGLQYFWVDTCCIDKSNNTELAEAINSMFRWYRRAKRCYVYLSDVSSPAFNNTNHKLSQLPCESAFRKSRWFTRGWTLQELLAPNLVEFFSREGSLLGDKRCLEKQIHEITGINVPALQGTSLSYFGIDERLLWAQNRQTTRKEDQAYSLLGIFDVYMPLIYGEGRDNALRRLLNELYKHSQRPDTTPLTQSPASSREIFPYGIKLLHDSENSAVDIVFVHGLTGGREKTWKTASAAFPWPQALLPSKIPNARILTFGYDAYVTDWRDIMSKNRIGNHSTNLLTAIATYREDDNTNDRPIIFVCHSLGGLVCQDALSTAQQRPEQHLKQTFNCTRGIIFLGTPHRRSGLAYWAESLAKAIGLLKQTDPELLAALKRDSEILEQIQNGFYTVIRSQDRLALIKIAFFFEEFPLHSIGIVVPSHSATLPGYIPIGIRSNHMDMTKFEDVEDPGFIYIAGELRRWIKELINTKNAGSRQLGIGSSQDIASGGAGQSSSERKVINITQGGSQFNGTITVCGGTLFQGNHIGRGGGIF